MYHVTLLVMYSSHYEGAPPVIESINLKDCPYEIKSQLLPFPHLYNYASEFTMLSSHVATHVSLMDDQGDQPPKCRSCVFSPSPIPFSVRSPVYLLFLWFHPASV